MAQKFLTRIILTALFIIFLIMIYVYFFSGLIKPTCSSQQEFAMADLVSKATNIYNPTYSSIRFLKIYDCTEEIELRTDGYKIIYKNDYKITSKDKCEIAGKEVDKYCFDSTSVFKDKFPVYIDATEVKSKIPMPDVKGDIYMVEVHPLRLKFLSPSTLLP